MKKLQQFCLVFLMALALSIPVFAGDIQNGVAGETQFPGVTGDIHCGAAGDMQNGVAGDILGPGITGEICFPGFVQFLLALF